MFLKEFFYLPKSDRRILIIVAVIVGLVITLNVVLDTVETGDIQSDEHLVRQSDSLSRPLCAHKGQRHGPCYTPKSSYDAPVHQTERFVFDPNTADSTALLRLGLQPWQVRNIYKFRASGGIYRTKEDFARLYGLTQKEYRELEPYISISADYQPAALLVKSKSVSNDTLLFPKKIKEGETIDLNLTDTAQLKRVPGIGSYYARRIVEYGRRLGGFVNVDQLDELEHFPTSAKQYFVIIAAEPKRLNLNELSVNALKQHPYLNYYQARAITDYRRKHGPIKSLDDLRLLPDFSPEQLLRLKPYVAF